MCINRLALNTEQRSSIDSIYRTKQETVLMFPSDKSGQENAAQVMHHHGLDRQSREALESRWSIQWSTSWPSGAPGNRLWRILLQWYVGPWCGKLRTCSNYICSCSSSGYCSDAKFSANARAAARSNSIQGVRRNPYDFTGCLSHVEITERESDGAVTRVVGCLEHNEACSQASIVRRPPVPLHPHVYEAALEQLRSGARCV